MISRTAIAHAHRDMSVNFVPVVSISDFLCVVYQQVEYSGQDIKDKNSPPISVGL